MLSTNCCTSERASLLASSPEPSCTISLVEGVKEKVDVSRAADGVAVLSAAAAEREERRAIPGDRGPAVDVRIPFS